jgi:hypothetical protein
MARAETFDLREPHAVRRNGPWRWRTHKKMWLARILMLTVLICLAAARSSAAQETAAQRADSSDESMAQLLEHVRAQDARLKQLEAEVERLKSGQPKTEGEPGAGTAAVNPAAPGESGGAPVVTAVPAEVAPEAPAVQTETTSGGHEHSMQLPGGGPVLKIRGFADFNLGFGSDANSLIFPLPKPVHNTFQIGEFDLFFSSRLSRKVSFLSELIVGTDASNEWGLDIERLQISYKVNHYFEISGGRYHTSIGYYNTAFHHGTWFQTATGRPFMYFFEDSGGVLPVHSVGITATGLVPHTGEMELHWIAEVGNGRASDPNVAPVQNFLSDKNRKDINLAAYIKPAKLPGLQVGGSFYYDRLIPVGIPHVNQSISSVYAVYINSAWEFLNEAVLMHDRPQMFSKSFNSPLVYTQISRKFGAYRPYFRFQYLNIPNNDPVSIYTGRYEGPSVGLRMDFTDYAALKVQYNRLYQRTLPPENGLDMQVAFTF